MALDLRSGQERWRRERGPLQLISASDQTGVAVRPAVLDRSRLEGLDTGTGASQWTVELPPGQPVVQTAPGAPVIAVQVVAESDNGSTSTPAATSSKDATAASAITVYDRDSGEPRFSVEGNVETAGLTDRLVLVARGDELMAVDATDGSFRWSVPFAHPCGTEVQHAPDACSGPPCGPCDHRRGEGALRRDA